MTQGRFASTQEILDYLGSRSNWGRWGPDDQRGTLNLITPDKVRAAAALVRTGRRVAMTRPFPTRPSAANLFPAQHYVQAFPRSAGYGVVMDYLGINYHGHASTHIDALGHVWGPDGLYNGADPDEHVSGTGVGWGGIEQWGDGIVTRGVLIDVPRHRGVPSVTPEHPVTADEVERILAAQGVALEPGDALVVFQGREAWQMERPQWPPPPWLQTEDRARPGLDASCLRIIRERDVAVLVWDFTESNPSEYDLPFPIHTAVPAFGLALVDNALLEPLATACAEEGRYEFLFMLAPLHIIGGTGSPANPLAVL